LEYPEEADLVVGPVEDDESGAADEDVEDVVDVADVEDVEDADVEGGGVVDGDGVEVVASVGTDVGVTGLGTIVVNMASRMLLVGTIDRRLVKNKIDTEGRRT
jgi:hypothetical protein